MTSRWMVGIVVIAALLFGGWVYLARPEHKYRLTVEVVTPQGVVAASNVMAAHRGKLSIGTIGGGVGMKGDALFLDLGGGRNLIATLTHRPDGSYVDGMIYLAMNAYAAAGRKVPFKEVKQLTGKVPVSGELIPTLVTFTDLNDPATARVLDAGQIETTFGQGYRMQGVWLETVPVGLWPFDFGGPLGAPVTRGIQKKLPLLTTHQAQLRSVIRNMPPRFQLSIDAFTR